MLKVAFSLFFFFILTGCQSAFLNYVSFDFLKADIGIPLIVHQTFFGSPGSAFWVALFVGLIQEGFSTCAPGTLVFSKISLFLLCFYARLRLYIESEYTFGAICGTCALFESFLVLGLSLFTKGDTSNLMNILLYVLPTSMLTALFSLPVHSILGRFGHRYVEREWE